MSEENKEIIAYKGFNQDWTCRGYQYEMGKTYEHKGDVKTCESGFHSCEYPLDVFSYYAPCESKFAVVKASGKISKDGDDSKIASAKITVEAEINIPEMVKKAVNWIKDKIDWDNAKETNAGYQSAATNTGDWSAATNTGNRSAAKVSGKHSVAAALGENSKAKAGAGGAIVCVYRNDDGDLIHIKASKVGENNIKADTWYTLDSDGEFVEVDNERN